MVEKDIARQADALRGLIAAKHGVKARDLEQAVRRAGRRLPRRVRAQAQVMIEAQKRAGHPKLMRTLDAVAVRGAYDAVRDHLGAIDVADQRWGRFLGLAGLVAFQVIVVAAAFVTWLWWAGHV